MSAPLMCNARDGTSHDAIRKFLEHHKVGYWDSYGSPVHRLAPKSLVNIYLPEEDDGHYRVYLGTLPDGTMQFFDPDPKQGVITIPEKTFELLWFSPRYGKRWALQIEPHANPSQYTP